MLFHAKCLGKYEDKNGNVWFNFVNDYGDRFSIKAKYMSCEQEPIKDSSCVCKVKAVFYEGRAFLAYDCISSS